MTPALAEPTQEQLRLAYRQLRRPNRWPDSIEAALAHPIYGICLRAMARQLNRPTMQEVAYPPPRVGQRGVPVPATPTEPPARRINGTAPAPAAPQPPQVALHLHRKRAAAHGKRAAANDFDDDD